MGNGLFVVDFPDRSVSATTLLAEGGFAFVYEAIDSNSCKYALKKVITSCQDKDSVHACKKEINVLKSLPSHPNIVTYHTSICLTDSMRDQKHFFVLEELCKCNVWDLVLQSEEQRLDERVILSIFQDVCMAVHHLHIQQPPIAHRDIKVENILIGYDGRAKLCDFASCSWKHIDPPENQSELLMVLDEIESHTTLDIRAPEQVDLHGGHKICEKVDIWALGVVLFVMSTGRNPFAVISTGIVEKLGILNCQYTFPEDWEHSGGLQDLIRFLLVPSSEERPSVFDVLMFCMGQSQWGNLSAWSCEIDEAVWPSRSPVDMAASANGDNTDVDDDSEEECGGLFVDSDSDTEEKKKQNSRKGTGGYQGGESMKHHSVTI